MQIKVSSEYKTVSDSEIESDLKVNEAIAAKIRVGLFLRIHSILFDCILLYYIIIYTV